MVYSLSKSKLKTQKSRKNDCPSVWSFYPFVTFRNLQFLPFIWKNNPSIPFQQRKGSAFGFTLIELVVTMAVAAILITVAVPNMRNFIQNGRLITQTNDLIGDFNFARSEAIKRRTNIGVCLSTDGVTCAAAGNWRDGRAIFADDITVNGVWDAGETILRFREPLAVATDTLTSNTAPPIIFNSNGRSNVAAGSFFTFCDDRGPTKGKRVNVGPTGTVGVDSAAPGAC